MANEIGNLNVKLSIDTSDAKAALDELLVSIEKLNEALSKLSVGLGADNE